jgi:hypothetical protein
MQEITQFAPIAAVVTNIAGVLGFVAAGFLIYAIASGRAGQAAQLGNVSTAAAILNLSAVIAAIGLIISQWSSRAVGPVLAALGMVFLAGVPAFLPKPVHSIASAFQSGGAFLLLLGLAKFGLDCAFGSSMQQSATSSRKEGRSPQSAPGQTTGAVLLPSAPGQPPPSGNVVGVQIMTVPGAPGTGTGTGSGAGAAGGGGAPSSARGVGGRGAGGHGVGAPPAPVAPGQPPFVPAENSGVEIIDDGNQLSRMRRAMESLDPIANWTFRAMGVLCILSLVFLLYAIFIGRIGQVVVPAGVAGNVKLAATVFQWALILVAISFVWISLDMPYLGAILIGAGLAIHFGAPLVLGGMGKTRLLAAVADTLRNAGFGLAVVGVLKQGYEVVTWAMNLPNRMKQKADVGFAQQAEPAQRKVAREATMFSPCWKLPYCREVIRKQCPAFLAKKTCWKFGRGCYCDEEMIGRIIRGESLDVIKAPTRLSQTGKPPCGRCHIYLEHQGYKYKMVSPLAFPGTAIVMFLIWPLYSRLFMAFTTSKIWDTLSFDTTKIAPDSIKTNPNNATVSSLDPEQVAHFATILIGVLVGFFVFVYISKFIEWAIYKAKM